MTERVLEKLKNAVPIDRPGFDTFGMSAPALIQMNPEGKWQNRKPDSLDEVKLKAVVEHLVSSKAINAAQSYCCQCAAENKQKGGGLTSYVPVIMMPIYPADKCPFDLECEVQKMKEAEATPVKKGKGLKAEQAKDSEAVKEKKKQKKRGFTMQRLTDFDLLSQW